MEKRRGQGAAVKVCALILVIGVLALPTWGQETGGELNGTVKDASGSVVPDASITVTNKATARVLTTKTGADGTYVARALEPGHYSIRVEASGFAPAEFADVELLVGKTLKLDANLVLAPIEQSVSVIERAPLIDLTTPAVSHDIPAEEFARLPNARSFQSLLYLSPSVNSGVDQFGKVVGIEGGFQVNGASASENQFVIDGVPTQSLITGLQRQNAILEFLQDVQVKTGGIDAEYGGALGGVMSAITKSGGNRFHGDVHYYFSGNGISAGPVKRLLLDPVTQNSASYVQDAKPEDNRNEFGGTFGGYLLKDKVWFFAGASPQWRRAADNYLFNNGTQPGTVKQTQLYQSLFGKVSYDPTSRIRTNFTWLNTPIYSTGSLPKYDAAGNMVVAPLSSHALDNQIGFTQAETSYTGSVDIVLSHRALLSIRGGRYWDDYKDWGVPPVSTVRYSTGTNTLPQALQNTIPAADQQLARFVSTPLTQRNLFDITTRSFIQADFSLIQNFWGTHSLKLGAGTGKNVNRVNNTYPGGGVVTVVWGQAYKSPVIGSPCNLMPCSGTYGYYTLETFGTLGSAGASITNLYAQDDWQVRPRLTLSLGLRTEDETVPSFRRDLRDNVFRWGFGDKLAPRLGFAYDLTGKGNLKLSASWGLFYDTMKYQISRNQFGGTVDHIFVRSLDTPDALSLSGTNMPGADFYNPAVPGSFLDNRPLALTGSCTPQDLRNCVDPSTKPMSEGALNTTVEYQLDTRTVLRGSYVHNYLRRAIEDMGFMSGGTLYSYIGNPGEGAAKITPASGATTEAIPTPKPDRTYDAMELSVTRRFAAHWLFNGSYVFSRLYGNYTGLSDTDEVLTPTTGGSFGTAQQQASNLVRPGTNTSRAWDLDQILFDSHGHLNVKGPLPTDRPHVLKLYGSYDFKTGTEVSANFHAGSGTPISTYVNTTNGISVFVNGRGDMGRTPVLTQTDLQIAQEIKLTESKRLRFEFTALNAFNAKTALHIFNCVNRGCLISGQQSSAMDLTHVDLYKGYDYKALVLASPNGQNAFDPRYGMADLFNPGFAGRFGLKFIF